MRPPRLQNIRFAHTVLAYKICYRHMRVLLLRIRGGFVPQPRIVIIGAGIVGLATALEFLRRHPQVELIVLEKEERIASHQTSHNSGVIHSGIYYKPGSLKARLCRTGSEEMVRFCCEHDVPCLNTGKVIVATKAEELPKLEELYQRGIANGIPGLRLLAREEVVELEPHTSGMRGIHVPGVCVTDFHKVAKKYAELIAERGGRILCSAAVLGIRETADGLVIETEQGDFDASYAVNCAGLQSDYVGRMAKAGNEVRIVPFRGEYYEIVPERHSLVNGLIYPVPDLRFPFLGVHFTRRVSGGIEAGPNAVFAFRRNGYRATDVSMRDLSSALFFPGFWKMSVRHWKSAVGEYYRSFFKAAFVRALQRLIPELSAEDLARSGSGVRAQALARDGSLLDDFRFEDTRRMMHVYNVPSPAATASLAIARELVTRISTAMQLN
jgi:L-2-hydroxyglutarate oxidase